MTGTHCVQGVVPEPRHRLCLGRRTTGLTP
jgi:hypothetical protein